MVTKPGLKRKRSIIREPKNVCRPRRRTKVTPKRNLQLTNYVLESHPELGC